MNIPLSIDPTPYCEYCLKDITEEQANKYFDFAACCDECAAGLEAVYTTLHEEEKDNEFAYEI